MIQLIQKKNDSQGVFASLCFIEDSRKPAKNGVWGLALHLPYLIFSLGDVARYSVSRA